MESWGTWEGHVHTAVFEMDNQRTYCTAQGTLLDVTRKPGWAGDLGEGGFMCTYGRVPLLST